MFKSVISPVQAWLLSQGRCVGCGKDLASGKREKPKKVKGERVICSCGRIFIYEMETKKYRRALFEEI